MDLNKVQLIGNITSDIELKATPNGQNVISFGIATNRKWTDKEGNNQEMVEFSNIVLWGKLAEICNQYCKKGDKIYIEGRLQTRKWEAQDGTNRYRTEIVGENMIMLQGKGDGVVHTQDTNDYSVKKPDPKTEEITVDDIPF